MVVAFVSTLLLVLLNQREFVLLNTGLQNHTIEKISIGSAIWSFWLNGVQHNVLVFPADLQRTFTLAIRNDVSVEYYQDFIYQFLLACCFLPSAFLRYVRRGKSNSFSWYLAPLCALLVVVSLGLRLSYHTSDAEITFNCNRDCPPGQLKRGR